MKTRRGRPRLLLDCDEVLCDTLECILDYVNRFQPQDKLFRREMITKWDAFESIGREDLDAQWRKAVHDEKLCVKMKPFVGAPRFIHEVSKLVDVRIVTAPLQHCESWCDQRYQWLESTFGITHKHVVFSTDKSLIDGDIMVDDKLDNVIDWKMVHSGDAFIFDKPWNQQGRHFYVSGRVHSYKDIIDAVMEWV